MEPLDAERRREYARIAYYYYKSGLTQEEIADRTQMSRQKVNRILRQCAELGIVQIRIAGLEESHLEQEMRLEERYGLKSAQIAEVPENGSVTAAVGAAAAKYLVSILRDGDAVGFSRGHTVSSVADTLTRTGRKDVRAAQLMGGWNNQKLGISADDIVYRAAQNMDAAPMMLYAPVVVNERGLRDSIMKEPYFQEAYRAVCSCTIAVLGIGRIESLRSGGIPVMTEDEYRTYCAENAVGEVCSHFFDAAGKPVVTGFDERTIVIGLEDLLRIPLRIGVAGGVKVKLAAIRGALLGNYVNALVTDDATARALLEDGGTPAARPE